MNKIMEMFAEGVTVASKESEHPELSTTTLELSDAMLENFKQMYLEAAEKARTSEPGYGVEAGLSNNNVKAHGARFAVNISIQIAKIKQEFNA